MNMEAKSKCYQFKENHLAAKLVELYCWKRQASVFWLYTLFTLYTLFNIGYLIIYLKIIFKSNIC